MERIKTLLTFAIPFLTACGCLYHFAFWSTFNVNGLEFIELSDLVKSAVYPIATCGAIYILHGFLDFGKNISSSSINPYLFSFISLAFLAITTLTYYWVNDALWLLWGFGVGSILTLLIYSSGFLAEAITNGTERYKLIYCACLLLVLSFSAGKYSSEKIWKNHEFFYTIYNSIESKNTGGKNDTLKYIYSNVDRSVFISLNNSRIVILRNTDPLILYKH